MLDDKDNGGKIDEAKKHSIWFWLVVAALIILIAPFIRRTIESNF